MEYTIEFGIALVIILVIAMVFWGIYWKNEIQYTLTQRDKLKECIPLVPTKFSTTRKTDVITIESLQQHPSITRQQERIKQSAARSR